MRQERSRDGTECDGTDLITECRVELFMDTGEAERGPGMGKADDLALNTAHVSCPWDKPMEGSGWYLEEMEEIPTCLESGKGLEKAPEIVLTFALRPLGVH